MHACTHCGNECFPALFVPEAVGHDGLGVPDGEAHHDDPQDGQLVEQLAEEGEGGVEVGGGGAHHDQQQPYHVDPGAQFV